MLSSPICLWLPSVVHTREWPMQNRRNTQTVTCVKMKQMQTFLFYYYYWVCGFSFALNKNREVKGGKKSTLLAFLMLA